MIEFENVSFSYEGQEHDSLHGISLKIADGECVLFCGRSGCGKTTVTRLVNGLIPQFYQGELQGRVLVDGQEISVGGYAFPLCAYLLKALLTLFRHVESALSC